MDSMNTPSNLYALEVDEATLLGHRLLKAFHRLRLTRNREQLIALAERLVEDEERYPAGPGG
ncbi:hypothetical protein HL667_15755 [Bradyrhizobium sp. 83012]|uniref:Uncharacterized protein n=1 Tax=Bradyrhizobium aeschynomenes TaxID=2734909 RepID=A0ABX2CE36_9BRAD|nr:hypothetical protein [Bradyrhizobium aeschynomenes]NPU66458.1 hypothetical protein [Bradyrhizobium aeschynomenes]NPV20170.1 hypothetical protein [Bradyrhizobium aeschynomenes]